MTVHGHRLLREMLAFSTLETVKSHPDMVLGNQFWVALCEQGGLDQMALRGDFQPQPFSNSVLYSNLLTL